ncbi:MAG TPA: D-alanyl-D-alanine carboxypeptidase family protein [Pseudomonadales bacterium]|nr:D-alanyl-D-alanine carboxypeptidase family protein [Pseudomonadales bacterium]
MNFIKHTQQLFLHFSLAVVLLAMNNAMAAEPVPAPPELDAKAWILMDAASGVTLLEHNADERLPPASLTKLMTSYVLSAEVESGRVHNEDIVPVSPRAWAQSPEFDAKKNGSSLMFIEPNKPVTLLELHRGIIISSGNDATVAVAEYLAGTESAFVDLMNQYAKKLGLTNTHYVNTHGLDTTDHYSSARDLANLSRYIIKTKDYPLHKEKEFTYNGIKQQNRNGLLWKDSSVDGLKTGHTDGCGFCLVASAKRDDTRLISVVIGAPSIKGREGDSEALLNYGFRFFQAVNLYAADTVLGTPRVWEGTTDKVTAVPASEVMLIVPRNVASSLTHEVTVDSPLIAPISAGQKIGQIVVKNGDTVLKTVDVVAKEEVQRTGFFGALWDKLARFFSGLFGKPV